MGGYGSGMGMGMGGMGSMGPAGEHHLLQQKVAGLVLIAHQWYACTMFHLFTVHCMHLASVMAQESPAGLLSVYMLPYACVYISVLRHKQQMTGQESIQSVGQKQQCAGLDLSSVLVCRDKPVKHVHIVSRRSQ